MRCWSDPAKECAGRLKGRAQAKRGHRLSPAIDRGQPSHKENIMKIRRIWPAVLACAAMAGASIAAAGNFTTAAHSDFYSAGRHQFYVWCGGAGDHMAIESGKDAEDAQLRLYQQSKAAGHTSCWPVWQGRVAG
jgi:hypothetical protein